MQTPLADAIRPETIDDIVGQRHLLGQGAVLRRLIEQRMSARDFGNARGARNLCDEIIENHNARMNRVNFAELTNDDIAEAMNISTSTVKRYLRTGRERLARMLPEFRD